MARIVALDPDANICSMGADASPYARLTRALRAGRLAQADAAARELPSLGLDDAVAFVLLLHREADPRFERAALRLVGRILAERPGIGFTLAGDLVAGFAGLVGTAPEVARSQIALSLRGAGLSRAADHVAHAEPAPS